MKDPIIEIQDKGTKEIIYKGGLFLTISKLIFQGDLWLAGKDPINIYLNGKEVEKPPEMEEEG